MLVLALPALAALGTLTWVRLGFKGGKVLAACAIGFQLFYLTGSFFDELNRYMASVSRVTVYGGLDLLAALALVLIFGRVGRRRPDGDER